MQKAVTCSHSVIIERPVDEVRAQFCDIPYHATHNVHDGLRFTVHSVDGNVCRYAQEVRIAGMPQRDEAVNTLQPDGTLTTEVVRGMNTGAHLIFGFEPLDDNATVVSAHFTIPLRGAKALIAPVFQREVQRKLELYAQQDKADLESGAYERYRKSQYAAT